VQFHEVEFVDAVKDLNDRFAGAVHIDHARIAKAGVSLSLPVDEIANELERKYHLPAEDMAALREVLARGKAKPITFAARGITLRSALRHIVGQVDRDLTVLEMDGAAVITTREAALESLSTRVYDVRGLSPPPRPMESPLWAEPDELPPAVAEARETLPPIPVPLAEGDPDATLELAATISLHSAFFPVARADAFSDVTCSWLRRCSMQ
jgi:hypothetical protein